jgi:hypothetical protein
MASISETSASTLLRRRLNLCRAIERDQAIVAEIDAELRRRGIEPGLMSPLRQNRSPLFRNNELPRLCLAIMRRATAPMHIRELARAVLTEKRADLMDPRLLEWTVKRVRDVLGMYHARGLLRMVGYPQSKNVRWEIIAAYSGLPLTKLEPL